MRLSLLFAAAPVLLAVACGGELDDRSYHSSSLASRDGDGAEGCGPGAIETCTASGVEGMRQCEGGTWSACAVIGSCRPDEGDPLCPNAATTYAPCTRQGGAWVADESDCPAPSTQTGSSSTPLVLSFDRAPIAFTRPGGSFDLAGMEASVGTDWVSASTPWLALDLDGNGSIDDGAELFGSMTRLPDGRRAAHGFEALAALDSNGDGRISSLDARWSSLVLWNDHNQDRRSQPSELVSAERAGLESIDLGFHREMRCTGTACEVERASFEFRAAAGVSRGDVVDVHFAH